MNAITQARCLKLILLIKEKEDNTQRNELYTIMMPDLIKWVRSYLRRSKVKNPDTPFYHNGKNEALSLSWDCFIYGLERICAYKEITIPIRNHFSIATYQCLGQMLNKERIVDRYEIGFSDLPEGKDEDNNLSEEEIMDKDKIISIRDDNCEINLSSSIISGRDFLHMYRESLNDSDKIIFDDVLTSMISGNTRSIIRKGGKSRPYTCETKRRFKHLIGFFLSQVLK